MNPGKKEENYTIKRVTRLPKRGNRNLLYTLISNNIQEFYIWNLNGTYERITVGGSSSGGGEYTLSELTGSNTVNLLRDGQVVSTVDLSALNNPTQNLQQVVDAGATSTTSFGTIGSRVNVFSRDQENEPNQETILNEAGITVTDMTRNPLGTVTEQTETIIADGSITYRSTVGNVGTLQLNFPAISVLSSGNRNITIPYKTGDLEVISTINTSTPQTSATLNTSHPMATNPIGTKVVNLDSTERYTYTRISASLWRRGELMTNI